jgi:hypothetical protein
VAVVNTTTPEESTNQITQGGLPEEVDMSSEAQVEYAREEATTSSYASAEEESTTNNTPNNTPSVLLLYRIREALQAAKRTHDSIHWKNSNRKGPDRLENEAKVNNGIASLVQLVQSIKKMRQS